LGFGYTGQLPNCEGFRFEIRNRPTGHYLRGENECRSNSTRRDLDAGPAATTPIPTRYAVYAAGPKGAGAKEDGYLLWARGGALVAQVFNPRTLTLARDPVPLVEILNLTSPEGRLEVAASENGILLCGATAAVARLRWVDRKGNLLAELGEPSPAIYMFRLSPDERRVAVQIGSAGGSALWLLDADRGVPSRFTADPGHSTQPLWSPDGRTIIFTHFPTHDLLRKPANGIGEEQVITERPSNSTPSDWSRDGRWLLTREIDPKTKYDIWRIPVTPDGRLRQDEAPAPYLRTPFNEAEGRFSPEPRPRWPIPRMNRGNWRSISMPFRNRVARDGSRSRAAEVHSGVQAAASCTTAAQ